MCTKEHVLTCTYCTFKKYMHIKVFDKQDCWYLPPNWLHKVRCICHIKLKKMCHQHAVLTLSQLLWGTHHWLKRPKEKQLVKQKCSCEHQNPDLANKKTCPVKWGIIFKVKTTSSIFLSTTVDLTVTLVLISTIGCLAGTWKGYGCSQEACYCRERREGIHPECFPNFACTQFTSPYPLLVPAMHATFQVQFALKAVS